MVKKYSAIADQVIIIISNPSGKSQRKTKLGKVITPAMSSKIWQIYLKAAKLKNCLVTISNYPSPVTAAFSYVEEKIPDGTNIIFGSSTKGNDFTRWKSAQKYFSDKRPNITILDPQKTSVDPYQSPDGTPVSATSIRNNIDKPEEIKKYLPSDLSNQDISKILTILGENIQIKTSSIMTEGGASGHMSHLFEDPDLTFTDLKTIFKNIFSGEISVYEKTDGIALAITYKDGEVKAARNKKTLKDPMPISELDQMFEGRGPIRDAFVNSMFDISKAINTLSLRQKFQIFNNGRNYLAVEIIYPPTRNVIDYGNRCIIQMHGINIYDENWNKVSENKQIANDLYQLLNKNNALHQKVFEITKDSILHIKNSLSGKQSLQLILNKLRKIVGSLDWNTTIRQYSNKRLKTYIIHIAEKTGFNLKKYPILISKLVDRISSFSPHTITKNELLHVATSAGIDFKNDEFKNFINVVDSSKMEANIIAIKPIEDLVIEAGLVLMKNLNGYISADPSASAKKLSGELNKCIEELSSREHELDRSKLIRFKKNLSKLDQYQREVTGVEGIVFLYKGKVFKMTSTYSQCNQILGILKYG